MIPLDKLVEHECSSGSDSYVTLSKKPGRTSSLGLCAVNSDYSKVSVLYFEIIMLPIHFLSLCKP